MSFGRNNHRKALTHIQHRDIELPILQLPITPNEAASPAHSKNQKQNSESFPPGRTDANYPKSDKQNHTGSGICLNHRTLKTRDRLCDPQNAGDQLIRRPEHPGNPVTETRNIEAQGAQH